MGDIGIQASRQGNPTIFPKIKKALIGKMMMKMNNCRYFLLFFLMIIFADLDAGFIAVLAAVKVF